MSFIAASGFFVCFVFADPALPCLLVKYDSEYAVGRAKASVKPMIKYNHGA